MVESMMNLKFRPMLQSIAKIEEEPDFRSKKYVVVDETDQSLSFGLDNLSIDEEDDPRIAPVVLKHPDNVITVASYQRCASSSREGA